MVSKTVRHITKLSKYSYTINGSVTADRAIDRLEVETNNVIL